MTTTDHAIRVVAHAMATTALDYDVLVDEDNDFMPAELSAHEVLNEYNTNNDPAGTLAPDFMDAAREYVNSIDVKKSLSDDQLQEIGSNLYIFHAYPLADYELDVEPDKRIDNLYNSELTQSRVLTITTSSAVHHFSLDANKDGQ